MKKKCAARIATGALLVFSLLCAGQSAQATTNLITNGSFENGAFGWTLSPTGAEPIIYSGLSAGSPLTIGSPDLGGDSGVYFYTDYGQQQLTQSVFLNAGSYEVGFDGLAGSFQNPGDASFAGSIGGITLANFFASAQPNSVWTHFSGIANVSVAGNYQADFIFNGIGPGAAKDVLVDRVYIIESSATGGTPIPSPVPEPSTVLLLGAGLAGLACTRLRKK